MQVPIKNELQTFEVIEVEKFIYHPLTLFDNTHSRSTA